MFLYIVKIVKEVVINMVKNMIVFICLLVILVCVISIFNARVIARKRFENVEENKATKIIKIAGYVVSVCMLGIIYIYMR